MQFFDLMSSKLAAAVFSLGFSVLMFATAIVPATNPVLTGTIA